MFKKKDSNKGKYFSLNDWKEQIEQSKVHLASNGKWSIFKNNEYYVFNAQETPSNAPEIEITMDGANMPPPRPKPELQIKMESKINEKEFENTNDNNNKRRLKDNDRKQADKSKKTKHTARKSTTNITFSQNDQKIKIENNQKSKLVLLKHPKESNKEEYEQIKQDARYVKKKPNDDAFWVCVVIYLIKLCVCCI